MKVIKICSHHNSIRRKSRLRKDYIQISRENNIIQIDLPYGSTSALPPCKFIWAKFGLPEPIGLFVFNKKYKMDSKICF